MFLLVTPEVLGMFFDILTIDHMYSLCNNNNLSQSFQMQFSKKQKNLSNFFASFLKSTRIFNIFFEKDDPRRLCISEILNIRAVF